MTDPESLIGLQLDEYRLEKLLGQGGMASVYLGLDVYLKRYAAIKIIASSYVAEKDFLVRFEREARAIAQIEHPHVVRLYRYGESNGVLYMAMQYIEGVDLESLLTGYRQSKKFMDPQEVLKMVKQIASALDHIHSKGIIHRDVKSSNIMLDRNGTAYLTDFGLALTISLGTRGEVFGSPHYISPEQALSSAKAVPQSDLYSLGIVLYEIFTGKLPFDAKEPLDIAMMHLTYPVPPPRELRPEISPALEAVVLKSLAKRPEDRYNTCEELVLALEAAINPPVERIEPPDLSSYYKETLPERLVSIPVDMTSHPSDIASELPVGGLREPSEPVSAVKLPEPEITPTPAEEKMVSVPPSLEVSSSPPKKVHKNRRLAPVYLGAGCVMIVLLCLAVEVAGLARVFREFTNAAASPTLGEGIPTVKASSTQPSTTTPPYEYQLIIKKCNDYSCFAVVNSGSVDFPLDSLRLTTDKDSTSGSRWGMEFLSPGSCVTISIKVDNRLPSGLDCNLEGPALTMKAKDFIGHETVYIFYRGDKSGTCDKDLLTCPIRIPIP